MYICIDLPTVTVTLKQSSIEAIFLYETGIAISCGATGRINIDRTLSFDYTLSQLGQIYRALNRALMGIETKDFKCYEGEAYGLYGSITILGG